MAGKGGGAWKVAYADFVTAMMAFFLVMWIVGQNKPVKEAIAGYFRDPAGSGLTPGGQGFLEGGAAKSKAGSDAKKRGGGGKLPTLAMIQTNNGTSVGAAVFFAEDSTQIDDAARERLDELTPLVVGKKTKLEIRAHATRGGQESPESTAAAWKLCYDRCLAIQKHLEEAGVEPERFRLSQAGPYEPQANTKDPLWRRRNSRVEIIMLSEYVDDYDKNREDAPEATVPAGEEDGAAEDSHGEAAHGADHAAPAAEHH